LDEAAREAGVILLNELGLDPGIDHMSAMRIIDYIHEKEGAVLEFYSFCGALPAPEASDNPFGYKFTWSPKGVLMAGNSDGVYLRHGKAVNVPTIDLFKNPFIVECPRAGTLEVYPNRDSLIYIDLYGIPEVQTMYRGTFRNQGWCEILDEMKQLNLFSYDPIDMTGMTYTDLMKYQSRVTDHEFTNSLAHQALKWLGLLDDTPINRGMASPFDVVSDLMIRKMSLKDDERDMIVLQHTFLAGFSDGRKEVIRSRMIDFGIPGEETSVARTVALPAAIGVEMILDGKITATGVHIPVIPEIYTPILEQLKTLGIKIEEEYNLPPSENIH